MKSSFRKVALCGALLWIAQGCTSPSAATFDEERSADVQAVTRKVMMTYDSAREHEGRFSTGWEEEPLEVACGALPSGARWLRVRYEAWLHGTSINVRARAEAFVHHGPHRKTWDWVNGRPFEEKLLGRILESVKRESGAN